MADVTRDLVEVELVVVRTTVPAEMAESYGPFDIKSVQKVLYWVAEALIVELRRSLAGEESGPEAAKQAARLNATVDGLVQAAATATFSSRDEPSA